MIRAIATGLLTVLASWALAQDAGIQDVELEDVDVSYIYPVVMGSGVYKIDGRRLTMLTAPISITQSRVDEDGADIGLTWFLPVTVGYDQIEDFDWLEQLIDESLVTLSAMPGVQVSIPLNDTWIVRPFAQIGLGHDFVSHEVFGLGVIGARLLGTWELDDNWELRWGASARLAGEQQFKIADQRLNLGAYYRLQSYYPEWTVGRFLTDRSEVNDVHELGLSIGLVTPREIFGFEVRRVRFGYQRGSGFRGWTFGSEFPF